MIVFSLDGKVALVTGAGQNVGAGIARILAEQGATVAVNDFHEDRAAETVEQITSAGGKAIALPFDVTDLTAVTAAVAKAAAEIGPIDILVNNAGNGGAAAPMTIVPFSQLDPSYWATVINVNLYGVLNCCKAVINSMIDRGWGRIITVSSGAGQQGLDIGVAIYGGAKSGANGFMRHLARENAPLGITCNTIAMGLCKEKPNPLQASLAEVIAVGRIGLPEDPAYLAAYLASPEASWITGQTIGMNGGALII